MRRLADQRLQEILDTRACSDLPASVSSIAYRTARLLLASQLWDDVFVFGDPFAVSQTAFALRLEGKWAIVFEWQDDFGPVEMVLKRIDTKGE